MLGGADFLSELPLDAELPWDFIELNFHKRYLAEEYRRSRAGEPTRPAPSRTAPTAAAAPSAKRNPLPAAWAGAAGPAARPPAAYRRLRLFYEKKGDMRFLSHLAMMQYLERLLRKSGLLFKYSEGFHPRIKMAALPPLPVGAEGLAEVIEVLLVAGDLPRPAEILEALNRSAEDFRFCKAVFVPGDALVPQGAAVSRVPFFLASQRGLRGRSGARQRGHRGPALCRRQLPLFRTRGWT